jgi:hypothetical protein
MRNVNMIEPQNQQSCQTSVMPSAFVLKKCTCCNLEFPKTEDYFRKNGNFFRSKCKNCLNKNLPKKTDIEKKERKSEMFKLWREKNRPRKTIKDNPIKVCCSCKKELPRTEEFFRKRSDLKNNFRSECKYCFDDKQRQRHIEFYKNNTEKEKQRHKYFYYRNPEYTKEKNRLQTIKFKPKQVVYDKKRIEDLTDSLIINRIVTQTGLKKEEIPKELIETKRLLTQLKRTLKNKNYGS